MLVQYPPRPEKQASKLKHNANNLFGRKRCNAKAEYIRGFFLSRTFLE
jgi:hypothetical protein